MRLIDRGDSEYPAPLLELSSSPRRLALRGGLPQGPTVAIVGARAATPEGCRLARRLGEDLARLGVAVVSGGALGIDAAAHRGALDGGGFTLAVLAQGVTRPSPRSNAGLFRKIVESGGGLLSECDVPQHRGAFVVRNRLIAALAQVLVVVEAKARSGTRSTIEAARALGRPVAAFPWRVADRRGEGCLEALREGAHLVRGARDVCALLGCAVDPVVPEAWAEVWTHLEEAEGSVDRFLAICPGGLAMLSRLELEGLIERPDPGYFRLIEPIRSASLRP